MRTLNQINDEITADQKKLNAATASLSKLQSASKPNPISVSSATAEVQLWTDAISRLEDEKTALATSEANNYKPLPTPPLTPTAADVSTLASEVLAAKTDPNQRNLLIFAGLALLAVGAFFIFRRKKN